MKEKNLTGSDQNLRDVFAIFDEKDQAKKSLISTNENFNITYRNPKKIKFFSSHGFMKNRNQSQEKHIESKNNDNLQSFCDGGN